MGNYNNTISDPAWAFRAKLYSSCGSGRRVNCLTYDELSDLRPQYKLYFEEF